MGSRSTVLLLLLSCALHARGQSPASIRLSETAWNFGTVRQAEGNVLKEIQIHNDGQEVLEISYFRVSCGCVHGELPVRSIGPGGAVKLSLELVVGKQSGEIKKSCTLKSNDPRQPVISIPVEGTIKADWRIEQPRLIFGDCKAGTSYRQDFRVLHDRDRDVHLLGFECLDPNVAIESEPLDDLASAEAGWLVRVTIKETAPAGPFAAAIIVKTNHPTVPLNHVMLYARISGSLQLRPMTAVRLGRTEKGASIQRTLVVNSSKEARLEITGVESTSEYLTATVVKDDEDGRWSILVSVRGSEGIGPSNESILIRTTSTTQEAIRVPVTWTTGTRKANRGDQVEVIPQDGLTGAPSRSGGP